MTTPRPPVVTMVARRTATPLATRHEFSYAVLSDAAPKSVSRERRTGRRLRTRLRSGKVADGEGQFLVECLIANLSPGGGMLRLPGAVALPPRIMLYDDGSGELLAALVVWRRDREVGLRLVPLDRGERHRGIAEALRRKFYAMRR